MVVDGSQNKNVGKCTVCHKPLQSLGRFGLKRLKYLRVKLIVNSLVWCRLNMILGS